ncbi:nucleolar complex protein 3 homolog, partial [Menidia menidia]
MAPSRSQKRRPSFRRLLKTSGLKLENKLKTRQQQQHNAAKKQRKEQKKLRQAVRGVAQQEPRPLETYRPRPEEEPEEEFLESLPLDMMEDGALEEMAAMARRASFLTRDLSSCPPAPRGKKRNNEPVPHYEKLPRKRAREEEAELIHLLPIKDRRGLIPQSIPKVRAPDQEDQDQEEDQDQDLDQDQDQDQDQEQDAPPPAQRKRHRQLKLNQRKQLIASLSSAIISEPLSNLKRLKALRGLLLEPDPSVAVSVRKLAMASLLEVFRDVAPAYRIRPLTAAEKAAKVRKETQQLREFEEGLVSQYKFYLEDLEQTVRDWRSRRVKRRRVVGLGALGGLALVAVRCLCELLVAMTHFNFHNNIIVALAPLMGAARPVSAMVCEAFRNLFQQDRVGGASLAAVRVISGLVKSLNYNVRPEVLRTLLSLRIQQVQLSRDLEASAPSRRPLSLKEKRRSLSRMQRKWKKAEEKLEKELLEAEASESKEKKIKLHTETLNIVFLVYFRILKKAQNSVLLPAVLEGLANFAHLINLEFFDDLLNVLQNLIQSGDLTNRERLHCIQTVFTILSGQGDVLNIDPLTFYSQLYRMLPQLHAGAPSDDIIIVLRCVDAMLTRRRKQVTLQRAMAFVKRLSMLSLHVLPNASVGILAASRATVHAFPRCDLLLDNETQGSGFYLPELDQPEHCNAQNTSLWELHTLQRHFHPVVRKFAFHLLHGAPSDGTAALGAELSRRWVRGQ